MAHADLIALWISFRRAAVTMVFLLILCTPLAWWLATGRSRWRVMVEALVSLPLVLPPTVLGFYLLVLLGPQGWPGHTLRTLGLESPVFSFSGLVIGSMRLRAGAHPLLARITRRSAAQLGIATGTKLYAQIKSVALMEQQA